MTYQIKGLSGDDFAGLFDLGDDELLRHRARRVIADAKEGFPCRVSLDFAQKGEQLLLLAHTNHDVETPFHAAYAIFVREGARAPAPLIDRTPPFFAGRTLSLRAFAADGMAVDARLAEPDAVDAVIRSLFANPAVAYINAHFAAHGCFAARVDRHQEDAR
jgi:hypothetical protein